MGILIFFNRKTVDLLLFFFHSDFCFRASKRTNINISCCLLGRSMKSSRLSMSLPSPQMAWKSRALGNRFPKDFQAKGIPITLPGGCCPQGGTAGVSRTHKGLFCSQGLFTKSALPVCQDHGERAELGQSPECTAWQIYSCLLLAPRQDATWLGRDQCIQVEKAGRGACAGEKHRELSEV